MTTPEARPMSSPDTTHAADGVTTLAHLTMRIDSVLSEIDRRMTLERAEMDRRFHTMEGVTDRRFLDAKEAVASALAQAEKATLKAEDLASQRAQQQNEWRATVDDISSTKMPRVEAEKAVEVLTTQVRDLAARVNQGSGRSDGGAQVIAWLVAAFGVMFGLVGTFLAFSGRN